MSTLLPSTMPLLHPLSATLALFAPVINSPLHFVKDVVSNVESEIYTSGSTFIDPFSARNVLPRGATILFAEAKGVAGLGKAGGDSQGGSDKAGQQVPPEVYNALTYAGTAFLFTLSVPLILYGLNKLLNKIEDCFGCGPSNKKSSNKKQATDNQRQANKTRNQQQIYTVTSSKPHLMYDPISGQLQNNGSSRIVSMSSDEDDQLSSSDNKHNQRKLHQQYSNHQSQLFTSAINGSIDNTNFPDVNNGNSNILTHSINSTSTLTPTASTAIQKAANVVPTPQRMHSQTKLTGSCGVTLPFDANPFSLDPSKRGTESVDSNNNINSNNDFNNDTATAYKPPIGAQMENQHINRNHQLQHDGNNVTKLYQDASVNINNGPKTQPFIMSSSSSPMRI